MTKDGGPSVEVVTRTSKTRLVLMGLHARQKKKMRVSCETSLAVVNCIGYERVIVAWIWPGFHNIP
jgi:hypothetical protein